MKGKRPLRQEGNKQERMKLALSRFGWWWPFPFSEVSSPQVLQTWAERHSIKKAPPDWDPGCQLPDPFRALHLVMPQHLLSPISCVPNFGLILNSFMNLFVIGRVLRASYMKPDCKLLNSSSGLHRFLRSKTSNSQAWQGTTPLPHIPSLGLILMCQ